MRKYVSLLVAACLAMVSSLSIMAIGKKSLSTQQPIPIQLLKELLPKEARMTHKGNGKTIILRTQKVGVEAELEGRPERKVFLSHKQLEGGYINLLDSIISENETPEYDKEFTALLTLPRIKPNMKRNYLLSGIVTSDGRSFSGKALSPDGRLIDEVSIVISDDTSTSKTYEKPSATSRNNLSKGFLGNSVLVKPAKSSVEVITITAAVAIIAVLGCLAGSYMTDCGSECKDHCGFNNVASYSEGWCGASCTCNCK
ncbi:MAG: hypothetical protein JNM09_29730 [Blastocatellia bacterium]|nr:hypothetical protein [Blastocatellia bacterium]